MISPIFEKKSNGFKLFELLPDNLGYIYKIDFYKDNQGVWVSGMYVDEDFKRMGYATEVIKYALCNFGEILFSNLPHGNQENYDVRYLTYEGEMFVKGLIKKGIITDEAYCSPYELFQ